MYAKKLFLALVAVAVVVGLFATPAAAAECTQFYTVRRGDTLAEIGRDFGVHWRTLAKINGIKNPSLIFAGTKLCVATTKTGTGGVTTPGTTTFPTFSIVSVDRNDSVTIRGVNFPANDTFVVRMGRMGTRAIGGIRVTTYDTGSGGSFTATFDIPAELQGMRQIAIRLESPTSGFFAYNWFFNNTTTGGTGGVDTPGTDGDGYTGFPTFSIQSVVRNSTVTIRGVNFPPNDTFVVRMGRMGTRGIGGIRVTTYSTDGGGSFTATFNIPAELQGMRQIAIRLESPTSGYFAYNWFYNNTAN